MKKLPHRAIGLFCLLAVCLSLCGCSMSRFNAETYLQGVLDQTYRGICDETYLALVDLSAEDIEQIYEQGLDAQLEQFALDFSLNLNSLDKETAAGLREFLSGLYSRTRWEVLCATQSESGAWLVEVSVRPVQYLRQLKQEFLPPFEQQFLLDHPLPEAEDADFVQETIDNAWAEGILNLCEGNLSSLSYGEQVTVTVRILPDKDGYYALDRFDFSLLNELLLPSASV